MCLNEWKKIHKRGGVESMWRRLLRILVRYPTLIRCKIVGLKPINLNLWVVWCLSILSIMGSLKKNRTSLGISPTPFTRWKVKLHCTAASVLAFFEYSEYTRHIILIQIFVFDPKILHNELLGENLGHDSEIYVNVWWDCLKWQIIHNERVGEVNF
jgi:hypothetical protein